MAVDIGLHNPFAEQLEFFRAKLALPSERYDDILRAAHDRAFIVAGAAQADLVNDLRQAMARRIEDGKGLEAFRKEFNAVVLKHGWTGWTGEGSERGYAWRTRIIYQTNMATSYAAGRWKQLKSPALLSILPYWRYIHSDAVMHPRPLHVSWNGLVLRHDHPFWGTHYPPNGWGCECRVMAVDKKEYEKAQAAGRTIPPAGWKVEDPITGAPPGIDRGWNYAPGANAMRPLKDFVDQKLIDLDAPVGAAMAEAMRPVLRAEMQAAYRSFLDEVLSDPVKRGRMAFAGAIDSATLDWLATRKDIVPASAEIVIQDSLIVGKKAERHREAGDALTEEEWARLPDMLENPEQILFDTRTGKLLYIAASDDPRQAKLAVEFDYKIKRDKGTRNLLVSAFKLLLGSIESGIKGGVYQVVK